MFQVFRSHQDRKTNSSICCLGEVTAQQSCFEIYWPLVQLQKYFNPIVLRVNKVDMKDVAEPSTLQFGAVLYESYDLHMTCILHSYISTFVQYLCNIYFDFPSIIEVCSCISLPCLLKRSKKQNRNTYVLKQLWGSILKQSCKLCTKSFFSYFAE